MIQFILVQILLLNISHHQIVPVVLPNLQAGICVLIKEKLPLPKDKNDHDIYSSLRVCKNLLQVIRC